MPPGTSLFHRIATPFAFSYIFAPSDPPLELNRGGSTDPWPPFLVNTETPGGPVSECLPPLLLRFWHSTFVAFKKCLDLIAPSYGGHLDTGDSVFLLAHVTPSRISWSRVASIYAIHISVSQRTTGVLSFDSSVISKGDQQKSPASAKKPRFFLHPWSSEDLTGSARLSSESYQNIEIC